MKIQIFTLMISIVLVFATGTQAGNGAAAFLKIPVGARAAAMGGAYVAVVNDASAVYWNPAGLASFQRFAVTSSMLSTKIGNIDIIDKLLARIDKMQKLLQEQPIITLEKLNNTMFSSQ